MAWNDGGIGRTSLEASRHMIIRSYLQPFDDLGYISVDVIPVPKLTLLVPPPGVQIAIDVTGEAVHRRSSRSNEGDFDPLSWQDASSDAMQHALHADPSTDAMQRNMLSVQIQARMPCKICLTTKVLRRWGDVRFG